MKGNRNRFWYIVISFRLWSLLIAVAMALTTACAKKDTISTTTARPRQPPPVRKSPPKKKSPPVKIKKLPTILYTIQLGAFKSSQAAERLISRLQEEGIDAYFYEDKNGYIKVRFGRFNSHKEAYKNAASLRSKKIIDDFLILQPREIKSYSRKIPREDPRRTLEQSLVKTAERFIGIPYRWGGTSAEKGFDCSGLTMTVYRLNGLELPRKASHQYRQGQPVLRKALKKGDLVFFATNGDNRISHVGIYKGEDKFIHAPGRGKRIRISSLSGEYYQKRYKGARRYF